MSTSELFPRLELVDIDKIRFHEEPEHQRTLRLVTRIRDEGRLRNPPILADTLDGFYLLLDGANRVSAFKELGHREVPAQIVDYGDPAIALSAWHHLLVEPADLDLHGQYGALEGIALRAVEPERLESLLTFRQIYAAWVDRDAQPWGLFPTEPDPPLSERITKLTAIIACYEGQTRLERLKLADYDHLPDVIRSRTYELCLFPSLTKEELLRTVRDERLMPTGITRHLIPGRALGLNLDLGFFDEMSEPAERATYFQAHVDRLEVEGRTRYYEEPVFIMNE